MERENEHQHHGQIQCGAGRWHGDSEAAEHAQSVQSAASVEGGGKTLALSEHRSVDEKHISSLTGFFSVATQKSE